MLLAVTLGIMCALFVMVVLWCRAAMKASARRAEDAAKRKLAAQSWAATKAARRKAQNDLLDRLNAETEAAKPILSAPIKAAFREPVPTYGDIRIAKAPKPTSRSRDDSSYASPAPYDYSSVSAVTSDYGSSSSSDSCSSSSDYSSGSCSVD